jgi:tryptophan synthase alpha chain
VAGITGARDRLPDDLSAFVQRVRSEAQRQSLAAPVYLAVGFGISTPTLSAQVAQIADGVIVGSALVKLAEQPGGDPGRAVADFAATLAQAARRP